jgi:hypothetical protein
MRELCAPPGDPALSHRDAGFREEPAVRRAGELQRDGLPAVKCASKERAMAKAGRNDKCPCGSGKKFKHCCANKEQAPWNSRLMMGVVVIVLLGAVYAGFSAINAGSAGGAAPPGKVWSAEHGHYH